MSFSKGPTNPDGSIKETESIKTQYAVTKKFVDQKTETIDLFSSLSKYAPEVFPLRLSSKKKQRAGITQTTTQTVKFFIIVISVSLLSIHQD